MTKTEKVLILASGMAALTAVWYGPTSNGHLAAAISLATMWLYVVIQCELHVLAKSALKKVWEFATEPRSRPYGKAEFVSELLGITAICCLFGAAIVSYSPRLQTCLAIIGGLTGIAAIHRAIIIYKKQCEEDGG